MTEDTHRGSAWFLAYLAAIRTRPAMYLGTEDVATLAMYVSGYCDGRESVGYPSFAAEEASILRDFENWMRSRLERGNNCDWPMLVGLVDSSATNLKTFYSLFDEFLESVGMAWPTGEHAALRKKWLGEGSA